MKRIRGAPENAVEVARTLGQAGTPAEQVLWEFLRRRRLNGLKFRRQHPLGSFVVDFCCPARRLIVELDGVVHEDQRDKDATRTEQLEAYGYQVIRFDNLDVVNHIDDVLARIARRNVLNAER